MGSVGRIRLLEYRLFSLRLLSVKSVTLLLTLFAYTSSIFAQAPLQTSSKVVVDDGYDYTELSVTPWGGSHGIFFGAKQNYNGSGDLWSNNNVVYAQPAGQYSYGAFSMGYIANGGIFGFYDGGLSTGAGNPVTWHPVMIMNRGGSIEIGTASPAAKLHISPGTAFFETLSNNQIALYNSGTNYGTIFTPGSKKWSLGYSSGISRIGSSVLTWTDDGNVGIGTSAPQFKLAVNGDIFCKKIRVTQTGWADYVFYPNYKLQSLEEVEKYIKRNNHLSDVPSANTVENNGLDLGDNQAILLKKIEELTLYIIQLDHKIESQEREINELREVKGDLEAIKPTIKSR
jgi:hypothetical protein